MSTGVQGRARVVRGLAALAFVVGTLVATARPAEAGPVLQCQLSMQVRHTFIPLTGLARYTVTFGGGSCFGDGEGTYIATIVGGTGQSVGFGPGDNCPTQSASNLTLALDIVLLSTQTGITRQVTESLQAPGPIVMPGSQPVTANSPGKPSGAGVFSYRIFHECPPGGNDSASYVGTIAN